MLPDRIETGTYAMAVAATGGEVELVGTRGDLIGAVIPLLESAGVADRSRPIAACASRATARTSPAST